MYSTGTVPVPVIVMRTHKFTPPHRARSQTLVSAGLANTAVSDSQQVIGVPLMDVAELQHA